MPGRLQPRNMDVGGHQHVDGKRTGCGLRRTLRKLFTLPVRFLPQFPSFLNFLDSFKSNSSEESMSNTWHASYTQLNSFSMCIFGRSNILWKNFLQSFGHIRPVESMSTTWGSTNCITFICDWILLCAKKCMRILNDLPCLKNFLQILGPIRSEESMSYLRFSKMRIFHFYAIEFF